MKKLNRILAGASAAIIAAIAPATIMAWGPIEGREGRVFFDYNDTATYPNYPAFNSFRNSPTWGFEPDFMSIKRSTETSWANGDIANLVPGATYDVVMLFHNNAACQSGHDAHNVRVDIDFPAFVRGGVDTRGSAAITSSNAIPNRIWSTLTFRSEHDMLLRYVQGSARQTMSGGTAQQFPNQGRDLFTSQGQLVGENFSGTVRPCDGHSGMIEFQIVADQPNFTAKQQVRLAGTTQWADSVNAKTGDIVEFMLTYENTGTTNQSNLVFVSRLPVGLAYMESSTCIRNPNNLGSGNAADMCGGRGNQLPDGIAANGYTLAASHAPGAVTYVWFKAKVTGQVACDSQTFTNTGTIRTADGQISDTANVVVDSGVRCGTGEIPRTGPASTVAAIAGAGSVVTAGAYYIASRKKLQ
jgi:uncharacterized repeat protein (TIGR01451 family)